MTSGQAGGGRRLGRGLESLLGPVTREAAEAEGALRELPVDRIKPNPFQPRTTFDPPQMEELTASIAVSGLLQPVVVRTKGKQFELIAGERRLRAVQTLGWPTIAAVVKDVDDRTLLTLALIENLQRHDLSPIDEAQGYQRLSDDFSMSASAIADLIGRSRSTVANLLRLLQLPDDVQQRVRDGALSEGHARALLALDSPAAMSTMARQIAKEGWSVRDVESRVKSAGRRSGRKRGALPATGDARRIEDALRKQLGTDVRVTQKRKGRGLVSLSYYSHDDLARLLELLLGRPFDG